MNLLGRKITLQNFIKPGIILLIPVFLGCETSDDLGIQYDLDSDANVKFVEFTLTTSNVIVDSLRTDGEDQVLAGRYTDDITGTIAAEGYFQFFYETGPLPRDEESKEVPNPTDSLQLDSAILTLKADALVPIRGSIMQDFSIYELQDSLNRELIYLSNLESTKGDLIGTYSKNINAALDTIYRIKLNNTFTDPLYSLLGEISMDSTRSQVLEVFQSLAIVSNAGSESIASFDLNNDTSRLVLYSSPVSTQSKDTTYLTSFQFSGQNYTYLDRSTSTYGNLENGEKFSLPSEETIIDPLYGVSTTYSIDQMETFFEENQNIIINNASILFDVQNETLRDTLKSSYSFFLRDGGFFAPGLLINSFSSLIMNDVAYLSGQTNPAVSQLNEDKDGLRLNATLFFQTLYRNYNEFGTLVFENAFSDEPLALNEFIMISSDNVTLNRAVFPNEGIKLRIYYTEVN